MQNESQIVLYQPDDSIRLEVKIDAGNETVWLTQQQIAELFGTKRPAITKHLSNIYKSGELDKASTCSILEHMGNDGKQHYTTASYNLDVILSAGYSINRHLVALQERTDQRFANIEQRLDNQQKQIDFFIRTNVPPVEGIFYEGQVLDARLFAEQLIKIAKREVVLIDNYIDSRSFDILELRNPEVEATIYVERIGRGLQSLQQTAHTQTGRTVHLAETRQRVHDRFLIIDDEVYHLGASLNELGKRLFAFSRLQMDKEIIMRSVITHQ